MIHIRAINKYAGPKLAIIVIKADEEEFSSGSAASVVSSSCFINGNVLGKSPVWFYLCSRILVPKGCRCRSWPKSSLLVLVFPANKWDPAIAIRREPVSFHVPVAVLIKFLATEIYCCARNSATAQFWWLGKIGPFPPECANVRRKIWNKGRL